MFPENTRITLIASHYRPETFASANRMDVLTQNLISKGVTLDVVCPFPNYPQRRLYDGFTRGLLRVEKKNNLRVIRLRPFLFSSRNKYVRLISESIFSLQALVVSLLLRRPSIVLVSTPYMFLAVTGLVLSRIKRVKLVWDVRDITWRYISIFKSPVSRIVGKTLENLMHYVAKKASVISVSNREQMDYFSRLVDADRIILFQNGVDDNLFKIFSGEDGRDKGQAPFTILYAGLIGYPQKVSTLIEAAKTLRRQGVETRTLIIGDGVEKRILEEMCDGHPEHDIQFLGYVPRDTLISYYKSAGILWAQLRRDGIFSTALPSKLFEYMATGKPIVFGGDGAGAEILREAQAGIVVDPEDHEQLAKAIAALASNKGVRAQLGKNARCYAEMNLSSTLCDRFTACLENVVHDS